MKNTEHLPDHTLEQLSKHELFGKELVQALSHIENCDECHQRMPKRSTADTLRTILASDSFNDRESMAPEKSSEERAPFWFKWGFNFAFGAAALLALAAGIWFLTMSGSQQKVDETAQLKTPDMPGNSNTAQPLTNTSPGANSNALPEVPNDQPLKGPRDTMTEGNSAQKSLNSNGRDLVASTNMSRPVMEANPALKTKNRGQEVKPSRIAVADNPLTRFLKTTPAIILSLRPSAALTRGNPDRPDDEKEFLTPYGEVVRDTKPVFSWSKLRDAKEYKVTILDETYDEIETAKVTSTSHRSIKDLERGKLYLWKVTGEGGTKSASIPSDPKPPAMFRVASKQTIDKLEKLERENADDLKLVGFLLDQGLLGEAEEKLSALSNRSRKNPLIKKLLAKVRSLRGT